jgi:hypothetical protein
MKLYEFFGNIQHDHEDPSDKSKPTHGEEKELGDQVFWYILVDDDLHKKYFMPLAKELKKIYDSKSKQDDLHDWKLWMPMVKQGCVHYYKHNEVKGDPVDVFNKDFRIDLCKRLADHHHKDIIKGEYKLG